MNLNDETIRKIMAETVSRSLDQMVLNLFMGNAHTSSGGVDWVSFERGESCGAYTDTTDASGTEPSGFTWHKEYVVDYTTPADSLVIEGECREVGFKELPAGAVVLK